MKEKITSILRHFFTGAAALAVDAGLIGQDDADSIVRLAAAAFAIIVSRIIIWFLGKINFTQFFTDLGKNGGTTGLLLMAAIGATAFMGFTSCAPSANGSAPSLKTTADGCILVGKTETTIDGSIKEYYTGICMDQRKFVQWTTEDLEGNAIDVRATYHNNGTYDVSYREGDVWLSYSSKSGFNIGVPPGGKNSFLQKPIKPTGDK